jgi:hypothetical protein
MTRRPTRQASTIVLEHEAQDDAFVAEPVGRGRGRHGPLSVDHLAHDAARGVRRAHQDRRDAKPRRGDLLRFVYLEFGTTLSV